MAKRMKKTPVALEHPEEELDPQQHTTEEDTDPAAMQDPVGLTSAEQRRGPEVERVPDEPRPAEARIPVEEEPWVRSRRRLGS